MTIKYKKKIILMFNVKIQFQFEFEILDWWNQQDFLLIVLTVVHIFFFSSLLETWTKSCNMNYE